jgi:hypothetical protein
MTLKNFLIVSISFLIGALVATVVVWYVLIRPATFSPVESTVAETGATEAPGATDTSEATAADEAAPLPALEESLTVDLSTLSEPQRLLARTLGVEGDTLVITPAMQVCAELKIGAARLTAIIGGDTPTFTEGAALVGCLNE